MSETGWLLFAILVWGCVLGLVVLMLRLVRGRPFLRKHVRDSRRARHY